MSLKDRTAAPPRGHGLPCSVASARKQLDADDVAILDAWLDAVNGDPQRRTDWQIAVDLTDETGVRVSDQQVGKHRRRTCRCYRGVPKS